MRAIRHWRTGVWALAASASLSAAALAGTGALWEAPTGAALDEEKPPTFNKDLGERRRILLAPPGAAPAPIQPAVKMWYTPTPPARMVRLGQMVDTSREKSMAGVQPRCVSNAITPTPLRT